MRVESRRVIFGLSLLMFSVACDAAVSQIKTEQKIVALTFDDGPSVPYTEQLLQLLEAKRVKATFFLIGQQVMLQPALAKKIIKDGHEVGGHSNDWKSLAFRRRKTVESKLDKMDAAFAEIGITNNALFRPPGGLLSPGQGTIFKERELQIIGADVVVGDWKKVDAQTLLNRVLAKVRPGSIIVLHDGGGDRSSTIEAVPMIIDALRKEGYSLVTVGGLLKAE